MDTTTFDHRWARRATVRELTELRAALQRGDVTTEHVRGILGVLRNRAEKMPEKFTTLLDALVAENGFRVRPPRNEPPPPRGDTVTPVFLAIPSPRGGDNV